MKRKFLLILSLIFLVGIGVAIGVLASHNFQWSSVEETLESIQNNLQEDYGNEALTLKDPLTKGPQARRVQTFLESMERYWTVTTVTVPGIYQTDQAEYFDRLRTVESIAILDGTLYLLDLGEQYDIEDLEYSSMAALDFKTEYYGSDLDEGEPIGFDERVETVEIWKGATWSLLKLSDETLLLKHSNALLTLNRNDEPEPVECFDEWNNSYEIQETLRFYNYETVSPEDANSSADLATPPSDATPSDSAPERVAYTLPELRIQFQYAGDDTLYRPIGLTGEAEDLEWPNSVKFSSQSDLNCLNDSIQMETAITFYDNELEEDLFKKIGDWKNVLALDSAIETVNDGEHTYERIRSRSMGTGLVDYFFLENGNDVYVFTVTWLGTRTDSETWWSDEPTPAEYETVLETIEFL